MNSANLSEAYLGYTLLRNARLESTEFANSIMGFTLFVNCDLSKARGLELVKHSVESSIDTRSFLKSRGMIPETFLRGVGLSDLEIENAKLFNPKLSTSEVNNIQRKVHDLRSSQALQIKPLFISYSHHNSPFVDKLERRLKQNGIRCWRDIHHATAGKLETQIDKAINSTGITLLVLSKYSVKSDWVQHEVRKAREKEIDTRRDTLCPIALDNSWKTCQWPERLREQIMEYNILDFSKWQEQNQFNRMVTKLVDGLAIFYK